MSVLLMIDNQYFDPNPNRLYIRQHPHSYTMDSKPHQACSSLDLTCPTKASSFHLTRRLIMGPLTLTKLSLISTSFSIANAAGNDYYRRDIPPSCTQSTVTSYLGSPVFLAITNNIPYASYITDTSVTITITVLASGCPVSSSFSSSIVAASSSETSSFDPGTLTRALIHHLR